MTTKNKKGFRLKFSCPQKKQTLAIAFFFTSDKKVKLKEKIKNK